MIEDNTTWYLGTVGRSDSYKLAKYTDTNMSGYATSTNSKVGLLRFGELMAGQFNSYKKNMFYWTLTPMATTSMTSMRSIYNTSNANLTVLSDMIGIRPSLNLKSNVVITGGLGTKEQPFEIALQ